MCPLVGSSFTFVAPSCQLYQFKISMVACYIYQSINISIVNHGCICGYEAIALVNCYMCRPFCIIFGIMDKPFKWDETV